MHPNKFTFKAVVTVSNYLFARFSLYKNETILKKIPCGVSMRVSKTKYNTGQPFRIAYVGRLAQYEKNISDITKAFCDTVLLIPGTEAYIYGSGPDETAVRNILEEYNIQEKVFLMGNIPHSEIFNQLLNMHVITLMSDLEGLPVSLMEGMSLGVVPVCTNIKSGVAELVIEKLTGLYIDDPNDFSNKIKYLVENPDEWERLSTSAKNHIKENYNSEICTTSWINLFNESKSAVKKKINIPFTIKLPPVNPQLSETDNRKPSILSKVFRKIQRCFYNI